MFSARSRDGAQCLYWAAMACNQLVLNRRRLCYDEAVITSTRDAADMKIQKKRFSGLVLAASLFASAAMADSVVEIRQATAGGDPNSDVGGTRIRVDGAGVNRYDDVLTSTLDVWVAVRGKTPANAKEFNSLTLQVETQSIQAARPGAAWKNYQISLPYKNPRSHSVANVRISPVQRCNEHFNALSGAARANALKDGFNILLRNAYSLSATASWDLEPGNSAGAFKEEYIRNFTSEASADAILQCLALDRPKPRTQTTTQGVDRRPGKRMEPTLKTVKLRIEPAGIEMVSGQRCPTSLQLYGTVTTIRAFKGAALFYGPGFLTPLTALDFDDAGTRNVRGTYPLQWSNEPRLAGAAPTTGRSKTLTLRFNVVNADNEVLESVNDTVKVTCELVAAPPPVAVVGALAALVNFDARIRRADRGAPGGGTQLWVYNEGPDTAKDCVLHGRGGNVANWKELTTVDIAAKATVQVDTALLPRGPGLRFRLVCPQEPAAKRGNNTYELK